LDPWEVVDPLCAKYGFVPQVVHESSDFLNIGGFVDANLGVALVPASSIRVPSPQVTCFDLPDTEAHTLLHLAWVAQEGFPLLDEFIAMTRALIARDWRTQPAPE
jgi:DNA-binding transcriptional LysR family regulator